MCDFDSVSQSFSENKGEQTSEEDTEEEQETEDCSEEVSESENQKQTYGQVQKTLKNAGATDSGEAISFAELLKKVDMSEDKLGDRIDQLTRDGEVQEPHPGEFKLLGEPVEVKTRQ
jgi:hypothetical protein